MSVFWKQAGSRYQTMPDRIMGDLGIVSQVHLSENSGSVRADGTDAKRQFLCDLFDGLA